MSSGSAGDMHSLHPGVFILKWVLSSQQPAECHVQTICFRKWAGQTYRDSQALIHGLGLQSRPGSSEQAFPTEPRQQPMAPGSQGKEQPQAHLSIS